MRPRYVLFENVEGIISAKTADGESVLKYVLGDLEERGYSCTWGIFSASEVGAPHQRKRVFILAKSASTGLEGTARQSIQGRGERFTSTTRTKYPARPYQQQHEWEVPRTTVKRVGGTANGTAFRVDELRLLGNGVVPDTCELAFKTLIQQL
jgi:DNA (cytosine-5)-methyltransferase 1